MASGTWPAALKMSMAPPAPKRIVALVAETRPGVGLLTDAFGRGWPVGQIVMKLGAVVKKSLTTVRNTAVAWAGTGATPAIGSVIVCAGPSNDVVGTPMGP
jgi:hypothetical protein